MGSVFIFYIFFTLYFTCVYFLFVLWHAWIKYYYYCTAIGSIEFGSGVLTILSQLTQYIVTTLHNIVIRLQFGRWDDNVLTTLHKRLIETWFSTNVVRWLHEGNLCNVTEKFYMQRFHNIVFWFFNKVVLKGHTGFVGLFGLQNRLTYDFKGLPGMEKNGS